MNKPSLGVLGVSLLIFTEVMFFAGLISAYWVARLEAGEWPPLGQPRLPIASTAINTAVLLLSAFTMYKAQKQRKRSYLAITAILGTAFLVLQGREWVRLIAFGLRAQGSLYGAFFYTIVGAHGVHVLAAVIALCYYLWKFPKSLQPLALFWYFVVFLWPILYIIVYIL